MFLLKVLLKENKVLDQENTNLFVQIRGLQREIQVLIKENERVLNELRECQQVCNIVYDL